MKLLPSIFLICLFCSPVWANKLVFIHSYHLEYPWVKEYRHGFLGVVDEISIFEYEMNTKRRPASEFATIGDNAWEFIQQKQPDLVVLADDNALRLLGPRLIEKQLPSVFLGVNGNPRLYFSLAETMTGVLERPLMRRSVSMLREVVPNLKRVKVMMDNGVTSYAILETSFGNKMKQVISGIQVDTVLLATFELWKQNVALTQKEGYDAIIVANYAAMTNYQGKHVTLNEVSEWTGEHSPVPVFAFWAYSIGPGKAIGGLTISGLQQGIEAAKKVNTYFRTGKLPLISTPKRGTLVFSQQELGRWGLLLPKEISEKGIVLE